MEVEKSRNLFIYIFASMGRQYGLTLKKIVRFKFDDTEMCIKELDKVEFLDLSSDGKKLENC